MQAAYMSGSFPNLNIIYGSGRNSSFIIQELLMQDFYVFQKINFQNFSITWNKINNCSDLLISYPSIIQTQIKNMLPTSFKFTINSYIKTILSKTQENSRLKTRYLKGITIEQLFIISIFKDYVESPLYFVQLLKIIKTNQTHFFNFVFIFRSHRTNIYM